MEASRRLRTFRIAIQALEGQTYGRCEYSTRTLVVDPSHHPSDRELRATVLHEMIHAVVGRGGHHAPFWTELERLLALKARVTVGFPELAERGSAPHIIPRRFRRCRALFRPVFARQQRELDRLLRRPATSPTLMLTPAVMNRNVRTWPCRARNGERCGYTNPACTDSWTWTTACCPGRSGIVRPRTAGIAGAGSFIAPASRPGPNGWRPGSPQDSSVLTWITAARWNSGVI
jgi:hypothetical protein